MIEKINNDEMIKKIVNSYPAYAINATAHLKYDLLYYLREELFSKAEKLIEINPLLVISYIEDLLLAEIEKDDEYSESDSAYNDHVFYFKCNVLLIDAMLRVNFPTDPAAEVTNKVDDKSLFEAVYEVENMFFSIGVDLEIKKDAYFFLKHVDFLLLRDIEQKNVERANSLVHLTDNVLGKWFELGTEFEDIQYALVAFKVKNLISQGKLQAIEGNVNSQCELYDQAVLLMMQWYQRHADQKNANIIAHVVCLQEELHGLLEQLYENFQFKWTARFKLHLFSLTCMTNDTAGVSRMAAKMKGRCHFTSMEFLMYSHIHNILATQNREEGLGRTGKMMSVLIEYYSTLLMEPTMLSKQPFHQDQERPFQIVQSFMGYFFRMQNNKPGLDSIKKANEKLKSIFNEIMEKSNTLESLLSQDPMLIFNELILSKNKIKLLEKRVADLESQLSQKQEKPANSVSENQHHPFFSNPLGSPTKRPASTQKTPDSPVKKQRLNFEG